MKFLTKVLLAGTAVAVAKGLDNRLEISHYFVESGNLTDKFNNFRILHLSDFHCDKSAGLVDAIKNEEPDIICITGDMTHDTGTYLPFTNLLKQLVKIAPVYIVSGNHDVWRKDYPQLVEECRKIGAFVLRDDSIEIIRENAKIVVSGIEDPYAVNHSTVCKRIENSLLQLEKADGFNMLLFHRANLLDYLKDKGFDLILAGHMHGGQFRIPGKGGVVSPKTNFTSNSRVFFPKYFGGEYAHNNTKMIVSRGVGNPTILPRIFNRPEICMITLKKI